MNTKTMESISKSKHDRYNKYWTKMSELRSRSNSNNTCFHFISKHDNKATNFFRKYINVYDHGIDKIVYDAKHTLYAWSDRNHIGGLYTYGFYE